MIGVKPANRIAPRLDALRSDIASSLSSRILRENCFDSTYFTSLEPDLDAMWVLRRFCQNVSHDPARQFTSPLILFEHDLNIQTLPNVLPLIAVTHLTIVAMGHSNSNALWQLVPCQLPVHNHLLGINPASLTVRLRIWLVVI